MRGEIPSSQQTVVVREPAGQAVGQFAFIKYARALAGDEAKSSGKVGQAQHSPCLRGCAGGQKSMGKAGKPLQLPITRGIRLAVLMQPVGQRGRYGKTFCREADGLLQQVAKSKRAAP